MLLNPNIEIRKYSKVYLLYSLLYLPGLFLKDFTSILFVITSIFFFFNKKVLHIVLLLFVWIFSFGGAYHYGFLGQSLSSPIIKGTHFFLILITFFSLIFFRNNQFSIKGSEFRLVFLTIIGSIFVTLAIHFKFYSLYYLLNNYSWLFLTLIIIFLKKDVQILLFKFTFVIIFLNSLFGFCQQLLIPNYFLPNGYVLAEADVASGFLGPFQSQNLTTLSIVFSVIFLHNFFHSKKPIHLILFILFWLQPIFSYSKFSLLVGFSFFILFTIIYLSFFKKIFSLISLLILYLAFQLIPFNEITNSNERIFSGTNVIIKYLTNWSNIKSQPKVEGIYQSLDYNLFKDPVVFLFGNGIGYFFQEIEYNSELKKLGFDNRDVIGSSTFNFKATDFSIINLEIGIIPILLLFLFLLYLVHNNYSSNKTYDIIIFRLYLVFNFLVMFFYNQMVTNLLIYVPILILLLLSRKQLFGIKK